MRNVIVIELPFHIFTHGKSVICIQYIKSSRLKPPGQIKVWLKNDAWQEETCTWVEEDALQQEETI